MGITFERFSFGFWSRLGSWAKAWKIVHIQRNGDYNMGSLRVEVCSETPFIYMC